jgi:hypothetical protein
MKLLGKINERHISPETQRTADEILAETEEPTPHLGESGAPSLEVEAKKPPPENGVYELRGWKISVVGDTIDIRPHDGSSQKTHAYIVVGEDDDALQVLVAAGKVPKESQETQAGARPFTKEDEEEQNAQTNDEG